MEICQREAIKTLYTTIRNKNGLSTLTGGSRSEVSDIGNFFEI